VQGTRNVPIDESGAKVEFRTLAKISEDSVSG
jgi:hypothetical protein